MIKIRNSFTLVEFLVVIGIMAIVGSLAVPTFRIFQKRADLDNSAYEIIGKLRLAQNKTLASEESSSWGVHFSTSTSPQEYILFKGTNFDSRDASFDEVGEIPKKVEIYNINLTGGAREAVFEKINGSALQSGMVYLRLTDDFSQTRIIAIQPSGAVQSGNPAVPNDNQRIKDSRHVHFDYSRFIATSSEKLTLTFDYDISPVVKEVLLADNFKGGQIYWADEVDVVGQQQKLKIQTHKINNPDTQFSIHRDRRYNNKSLRIQISGDVTGYLIQYDASGQVTGGASIYVSNTASQ